MKIEITSRKTIGQARDEFHVAYPYLQLAFYNMPHNAYRASPEDFRINDLQLPIGHLRAIEHNGPVYLEPDMPVSQVERLFETGFGLYVQVLRKNRNQWLQTSRTDNMTLADQNARGRAFDMIETEVDPPPDYREQD